MLKSKNLIRLNPEVNHVVKLDFKECLEYSELALVNFRLGQIVDFCNKLKGFSNGDPLFSPLWWFCLNTYPRCFNHGGNHRGFGLDADTLFSSISGALEIHEYFCEIRSKFIAHSVNYMEYSDSVALFAPLESSDRKLMGIGDAMLIGDNYGFENIDSFLGIIQIAANWVSERRKELHKSLYRQVEEKPIDYWYGQPHHSSAHMEHTKQVKTNRKK